MKNVKVVVSALIILLWSFTFAKVDITGRVARAYSSEGAGFFPILSLLFLLLTIVLIWFYLRHEDYFVQ